MIVSQNNAALHGQEHPGPLSNAVIDAVRIYARALGEDELGRDTPRLRPFRGEPREVPRQIAR